MAEAAAELPGVRSTPGSGGGGPAAGPSAVGVCSAGGSAGGELAAVEGAGVVAVAPGVVVPGLGIDRVRLTTVALPAGERWKALGADPDRPFMKAMVKVVDGVVVSVWAHRIEGGWRMSVEVNPSRVLYPDGWGLCPLSRFPEAWEVVLAAVSELIDPGEDWSGEWQVRMVHLAVDFAGVDCNFVLRSLSAVRASYAKEKHLWFRCGPTAMAETLYVGNGRGKAKVYDKHAETEGAAPPGTLRYELAVGRAWLEKAGILASDDLSDEELVGAFFRERWAWTGFGSAIFAAPAAFALLHLPDLSKVQRLELFALFACEAHGQAPFPGCSEASLDRYQRFKRNNSVVPSASAFCVDSGAAVTRLDLDLGRQIGVES